MFVHHVFFWLKEEISNDDRQLFETALKGLLQIEGLKSGDMGRPASTAGGVIDTTYSYSLLTVFEDLEGHDVYQEHPVHKKFIEDCHHLWSKVVVYDSKTV